VPTAPVKANGQPTFSIRRSTAAPKAGRISTQRDATAAPTADEMASAAKAPASPNDHARAAPSTRCSAAVPASSSA
jgi:hypothetical protein